MAKNAKCTNIVKVFKMKRIALCIGNNEYSPMSPLSCAVQDATAMATKLTELGFDTQLAVNLDRVNMAKTIFDFTPKIKDCDATVLYYAGHGFQVKGENVLAPVDLNCLDDENVVHINAFPISALTNVFDDYPDKTKILILDACRDVLGTRGVAKGFGPMLAPKGTIIAFATSPGQSAKENLSTGHGYYTEALLKYIDLSRVPVETVFKKTRELLAGSTCGTQISWEHTSLIGNFYFNPDTIYCGAPYGEDAYADCSFSFESPFLKDIINDFKSYDWKYQRDAVSCLQNVKYTEARSSELFVLGRNIYQAADGGCYDAQDFIDRFATITYIPIEAKVHVLNGMAYEIYFDSNDMIRHQIKTGKSRYQKVIEYLEREEFYGSLSFIVEKLQRIADRPLYIPGQNEKMDFLLKVHTEADAICVDDILYQVKSVYRDTEEDKKPDTMEWPSKVDRRELSKRIAEKTAAPVDRIRLKFTPEVENGSMFLIPYNDFILRF